MTTWISWCSSRRRGKWHVPSPDPNLPPGTMLCSCSSTYGLKIETVTVKPADKLCATCATIAKKLEAP